MFCAELQVELAADLLDLIPPSLLLSTPAVGDRDNDDVLMIVRSDDWLELPSKKNRKRFCVPSFVLSQDFPERLIIREKRVIGRE